MSHLNSVPIEDKLKCLLCNSTYKSALSRNRHIKIEHKLTYEQYIMNNYFNNKYPTCKCGCGNTMRFIKTPFGVWFKDYSTNHFPHIKHTQETKDKIKINTQLAIKNKFGVDNIMEVKHYKDKIKETKKELYDNENYNNPTKQTNTLYKNHGVTNATYLVKNIKKSKIESEILLGFGSNAIGSFKYKNMTFDIKVDNNIYEIDGDFFHPTTLHNLTIIQINSVLNDYKKIKIIDNSEYTLYKTHISSIKHIQQITIEDLQYYSYIPNYNITDDQIIVNNKYIANYINNKGIDRLKKYKLLIIKFIRTFISQFNHYTNNELYVAIYKIITQPEDFTINNIKKYLR